MREHRVGRRQFFSRRDDGLIAHRWIKATGWLVCPPERAGPEEVGKGNDFDAAPTIARSLNHAMQPIRIRNVRKRLSYRLIGEESVF